MPLAGNHTNMLLAFECVARSASACVVAADGRELAFEQLADGDAEKKLVPMLDGLMRTYGVPARLALATGPGSFTGLRIGAVAARTLAWLEKIPVLAVDSLQARAAEAGDGLWWVLMPLKRDTTFHGLFRVTNCLASSCSLEILQATAACLDSNQPALHPLTAQATAIGPALSVKPQLATTWCPTVNGGSVAALTARGVARLASQAAPINWDRVLPAYHQLSAPELQRQAAHEAALANQPPPPH